MQVIAKVSVTNNLRQRNIVRGHQALLEKLFTYCHFLNILNIEDFLAEGGPIIIGTWFLWVTDICKIKCDHHWYMYLVFIDDRYLQDRI